MTENKKNSALNLDKLSFEEALVRLEETVQGLESGGLNLEESTRLFEEGMKLSRFCNEKLATAELKISRIQTAYGEQMRFLIDEEQESTEAEPC